MLNTSLSFIQPPIPLPPTLHRRRGAQPANHNALLHGLYSVQHITSLTRLPPSKPAFSEQAWLSPASGDASPATPLTEAGWFEQSVRYHREVLLQVYLSLEQAQDARTRVARLNLLSKVANSLSRLAYTQSVETRPLRDLQYVSLHAPALIQQHFRSHAITRDAGAFRSRINCKDFTSPVFAEPLCGCLSEPPFPFISPRQWHVLEPLLPPSERLGSRGRPNLDPRLLLDAIFWKFAHHARWQDLPSYYPPLLSCRRFYRRLFRSGRLASLYAALLNDFRSYAQVDLPTLVEQACFKILADRVVLRPDLAETWQLRTALLFLQQGAQTLRTIRREKVRECRRRFPTLRQHLQEQRTLQSLEADSTREPVYTPIDLDSFGSFRSSRRIHRSGSSSLPATKPSPAPQFPQPIRSVNSEKIVTLNRAPALLLQLPFVPLLPWSAGEPEFPLLQVDKSSSIR